MKEDLRNKYLVIRKNITNRKIKDNIIFNKVIKDKKIKETSIILIYVSYNNEVDTINLIKYFLKNKRIAVPKVENGIMNFYFINSLKDLTKGYCNILEPITEDKVTNFKDSVCITPGLSFNHQGYRIGYGKGFYDSFFHKHNVYALGLCYQECLSNINFQNSNDVPVNKVITD